MIGMTAMRQHFRGNMPNSFCSFRVGLKSDFCGTSKFPLTLYLCEALLMIVQVSRSMRNIKQEDLFDIW